MAKAFKCDICGAYVSWAHTISGFDFKIGEMRDEFTGTCIEMRKISDICEKCHDKVLSRVVEIYHQNEME